MEEDENKTEASGEATTENTETEAATTESTEDINYSDLADQDFGTALTVGAIPLIIFGVLVIVAIGVYFARKKSAWSAGDLEDMKDDGEAPMSEIDFPTTEERSKMDETEPAKKL